MPTLACVIAALALVGQAKPDPRILCPAGASLVELPAADGARVLRCVADVDGQPHGTEIWLSTTGIFMQRGSWERGIRHGVWERWYRSGHLMSRLTYNLGQIANATCLTEAKRKEFQCTPDYYPADWAPPSAERGVAPRPAGASDLPPAPPPQPHP